MTRRFLPCLLALTLVATFSSVRAEGPDDQYIQAYSLMQEGDRLAESGQTDVARARYREAQAALQKLQASYPAWNGQVVRYRLRYLEERAGPAVAVPGAPAAPARPAQPAPALEAEPDPRELRLRNLAETVQRLEGDKAVLEAKLREALAAQPAAVDPRELQRAEEKIRTLEKEKDLLRAALEQSRPANPADSDIGNLSSMRAALNETTLKLNDQREATAALAREKEILERRLKEVQQGASAPAGSPDNEALRRQLAEAQGALDSNRKSVAAVQEELTGLRQAKAELEQKLGSAGGAAGRQEKNLASRVKKLERERDDLQARLTGAQSAQPRRSFFRRNATGGDAASLRARLAALEAKKVPYTSDELALLRLPAAEFTGRAAAPANTTPRRVARPLPASAAPVVAEAQRAFNAGRFAEAEGKLGEVLKMDDRNPVTLTEIAIAQIQQDKLAEAEANLRRALDVDANDSRALTYLGLVKFQQHNLDEAFDVLSRAVQADPQNADAHNHLGITLSHRGQRTAAESALRKAIQLSPRNGSAHHNLAVVYATQQPPYLELARWHYDRALATGQPADPKLEARLNGANAPARP